jgi:hypothetical protein
MNAPERSLRICVAPGVYVLRTAPAKTRTTAMRAALALLTAMRRTKRGRAGTSGRIYLKDVRSARHGRSTHRP